MTAYVAYVIGLLVLVGIGMLVAAFLDRRRGRQIEHDLARPRRRFSRSKRRPPRGRS